MSDGLLAIAEHAQQYNKATAGQPKLDPKLLMTLKNAIDAGKYEELLKAGQALAAMQQGQNQGTVADQMSARAAQLEQEVQSMPEKLAAMRGQGQGAPGAPQGMPPPPGMNNQGPRPPNGGAAPQGMPPPPTVHAAQGGLMRLPTNLPQSYAGGGIIAFGEPDGDQLVPGGVATSAMRGVSEGTKETPDLSQTSLWDRFVADVGENHAATKEGFKRWLNAHGTHTAGELSKQATSNYSNAASAPATPVAPPPETMPPSQSQVHAADNSAVNQTAQSLNYTPKQPAVTPQEPPVTGLPGAGVKVTSPQGGLKTLELPADQAEFSKDVRGVAKGVMHTDPEALRTARMAEADQAYGGKERAMRERQLADIQKQIAMNEEQNKATNPDTWANWLSSFDPNARTFGAGVGAKMLAGRAAQAEQKQKQLAGLRGLMDAQATGEIGDVKSRFTLGDTARKEGEDMRAKGLTAATQITDTDQRALATKQAANDVAQAHMLQIQEMHARAKEAATSRGDAQTQMQLVQLEKMFQAEGTKRAAAEAKQLGNLDETEINSRASRYANEMLVASNAYKQIAKKLGMSMDAPAATPSPSATTLTAAQEAKRQKILGK